MFTNMTQQQIPISTDVMPQVPSVLTQWFNKDKTITLNARLGYSHDFKGGHHVDAFIAYEQVNTIIPVFLPIVQIIYQQLFLKSCRKRCS